MMSKKVLLIISTLLVAPLPAHADDRRGSIEGISDTGIVWGWAENRDNRSEIVEVSVQVDNDPPMDVLAWESSLYMLTSPPGRNGFSFRLPPQYLNDATRTIRAWPKYGGPFLDNSYRTFRLTPQPERASIGAIERFQHTTRMLSGWLVDPDDPFRDEIAYRIILIFDGELGTGLFDGTTGDYLPRPDIVTLTGYPGNHGYAFAVPWSLLDGQSHTVRMYVEEPGMNIILVDPLPGQPPKVFNFTSLKPTN